MKLAFKKKKKGSIIDRLHSFSGQACIMSVRDYKSNYILSSFHRALIETRGGGGGGEGRGGAVLKTPQLLMVSLH